MQTRRDFLRDIAVGGAAAIFAEQLGAGILEAQTKPGWKSQIGLELYTVRDLMAHDYEGILAKVAALGYKEVEPAGGYNDMEPKKYLAMLDRYGLTMPSTHSPARGGPDLEKQLEGFQIMG